MGREIRRVRPGWEHPKLKDFDNNGWDAMMQRRKTPDAYQPMHEKLYTVRADEWLRDCLRWANREGLEEHEVKHRETHPYFWDWDGPPPDTEYYRHGKWAYTDEEATHYQMYETVTEGTPVSPVFATLEELQAWMVSTGNYSPEGAARFCEMGWAPSGIIIPGVSYTEGVEGMALIDKIEAAKS